ncbi:Gfo/Idh/MocA family protein [Microbacterium radiodurans]|uniref:Gfo/Idh/MocA family oxidoreductase n=1 Tax=Microbacterium radiodurans TaxID=661398 RepID=A0A5J5IVK0_9MICO|nr:Gfo/Idh/MocA family oxidoreductase [Microbacterium radiodurans]KAA9089729.1 Gfo/Idh/MocA family oxidoreductase [Microbacterium radiodurans]
MIRIATVGTSVITEAFVGAAQRTPGIEVVAVSSRDGDRARAYADRLGVSGSFGSLDALLDSSEVDAVYIGSPNAAHREQVARSLAAGKHVLVEKPAVATAAEWNDLVAQSHASGRVLLEAMRTAYDPGIAAVRDELARLGVIRRASLHYQKRSSRYDDVLAGGTPNIFDPAMGGGALADLGVYAVHAAVLLFGEPVTISAARVEIATGVDGAGIALLGYPGMVVDVSFSKITSSVRPSEIQGEDATLEIDHLASPRRLRTIPRGADATERDVAGETEAGVDALDAEVARFVELVSAGGVAAAAVDNARTAATLRTIERIRATFPN